MEIPENAIVAAGPVIIEDGKVLLNREQKKYGVTLWMFPGGMMEKFDNSPEDACIREAKEEMGIDLHILKPLRTITILVDQPIILIHFLAERIGNIKPADNIVEWGWKDINNLPKNCADNVYQIIADYKNLI